MRAGGGSVWWTWTRDCAINGECACCVNTIPPTSVRGRMDVLFEELQDHGTLVERAGRIVVGEPQGGD